MRISDWSSDVCSSDLLPIILSDAEVDELFQQVEANPGYQLQIDLAAQTVTRPDGKVLGFEIDAFRKHCLLNGLDDIGLTLQDGEAIAAFEAKHRASQPWLFRDRSEERRVGKECVSTCRSRWSP